MDFSYPDLDEPKVIPPPNNKDQSEPSREPSNQNVPNKLSSLPSVDRSLKPKTSGLRIDASNEILNNSKTMLREAVATSNKDKLSQIENSLYPDVPVNLLRDGSSKENQSSNRGAETSSSNRPVSAKDPRSSTNVVIGNTSRDRTKTGSRSESVNQSETGFGNKVLSQKNHNYRDESGLGKDANVESSSQIQQELVELGRIQNRKQEELVAFQKEKEQMSIEHTARMSRLKEEQEKILKLEAIRKKEEKDVADLMRQKRNLQEQMKSEESNQQERSQENELEEKQRYHQWWFRRKEGRKCFI